MTRLKWKVNLVYLKIVLILTKDRCTVALNKPKAQKLFWRHPMELLGDVGHVESCFHLFGDGVSFGAR